MKINAKNEGSTQRKTLRILYLKGFNVDCFFNCDPAGARTQDPLLKREMLYQLSYGIMEIA